MHKIVVLGGSGLLGSVMVPYLESCGYIVSSFCRNIKTKHDIVVDFTSESAVRFALDAINPNFIINLLALTDVDFCERHPNESYITNVLLIESVISWIEKNKNSHFVQISTDQVYDGSGPQVEKKIKLINYYSYSKFMAELCVSRVPSTIIRTNFFGKSNLKNRPSFTDWIYESVSNNIKISAFDDVYFSPLSMSSLCYFICLVIRKPLIGTFNIGSESGLSKADFIFLFVQGLGLSVERISRCSIDEMCLVAKRPKDMRMDCAKFKAAYNQNSMPLLQDEIKLTIKEYGNGI
jgi:dTDP-4-dehydrorhamnose reductase